jgi:predicted nucleotidyltransferase
MNEQIIELWKYLNVNNVKYLIVGGFAVNIYGYGRNTGDVDIYIEDTIDNRNNLEKVLKNIGIEGITSIQTMQFIPGWTDFPLNFGLKLDIMTSVKGLENKTFDELLNLATIIEIDERPVYFIDYENLIISKLATNRPKDILDITELKKLNNNSKA